MYMSKNIGTIKIVSEILVLEDNVNCFENIHIREKEGIHFSQAFFTSMFIYIVQVTLKMEIKYSLL